MRTRTLLRGGLATALVALLMSTVQSSRADEWYPGLPETTFGNWTSASQGGLSYAKRAKQWFRSPSAMTAAESFYYNDDTRPVPVGSRANRVDAEGYFVSPAGAPENYGYMEPMTVRSVGFGLMPVEATVQISQRREGGYPVPVKVSLPSVSVSRPGTLLTDRVFPSTTIEDSFNVRILSVLVDGVDIGLNGDCRTVEPAPVVMRSPEFTISGLGTGGTWASDDEYYRATDPSLYFNPIKGGELSGSMTIPPFIGCTTTSGDDLSDLLTLSASGPDNPVTARVGWPCAFRVDGGNAPAPPGASTPKLGTAAGGFHGANVPGCPGPKPFEYPEREGR